MPLLRLILVSVLFALPVAAQSDNDYLRGREAEASGDIAKAAASYQAVVTRDSVLKEYALWRLARIARSTGDLPLERERLRQLLATAPSSLLAETAALRLSQSFFDSGDFQAAADSAKPLSLSKNATLSREALLFTGEALARAGKPAEARETFTRLVMQMPDASRPDDFALAAVRKLDLVRQNANLSEAEHLLRASVYQFNRDFAGARRHYQTLIERYPQSSTLPNAMFQLARGFYLEVKYDDALKAVSESRRYVSRLAERSRGVGLHRFHLPAHEALRRRGRGLQALHRALSRCAKSGASVSKPHRRFARGWTAQRSPRLGATNALAFKNNIGGVLALFAQLRIRLAQANWPAAVRDAEELSKFSDLGGTRVPGGTNPAEISFLRAFALEQMGRTDEAVTAYLAIPDGRNEYYGMRATQRLLALGTQDKSRAVVQMRLNALLNETKSEQHEAARRRGTVSVAVDERSNKRAPNCCSVCGSRTTCWHHTGYRS